MDYGLYIHILDTEPLISKNQNGHLDRLRNLFLKLREAQLTVNLAKTELGCAYVTYLGHQVGQGQVKPLDAKVEAIVNFPTPKNRRELMRFLGMAGYYRKFCKNFSLVAEPLTRLLCKDKPFTWNMNCVGAFKKIKGLLMSAPVLVSPQFDKQFILMVDASDIGVGAVLVQEDHQGLEHPIAYFSQKFNKSQKNYCTSEKEALALILALHPPMSWHKPQHHQYTLHILEALQLSYLSCVGRWPGHFSYRTASPCTERTRLV